MHNQAYISHTSHERSIQCFQNTHMSWGKLTLMKTYWMGLSHPTHLPVVVLESSLPWQYGNNLNNIWEQHFERLTKNTIVLHMSNRAMHKNTPQKIKCRTPGLSSMNIRRVEGNSFMYVIFISQKSGVTEINKIIYKFRNMKSRILLRKSKTIFIHCQRKSYIIRKSFWIQ
jgi:hypothetical protein